MTEKEILKKVARTVTQEPVKIRLSKKPNPLIAKLSKMPVLARFFRFVGLLPSRTIYVQSLTLGTVYRISALVNELRIAKSNPNELKEWIYRILQDNAVVIAQILATAIWNKKDRMPVSQTEWILENFTLREIAEAMNSLVDNIDIGAFTSTIVSVRSVNILDPVETSQMDTGEIIAPGQGSELPSNTSA